MIRRRSSLRRRPGWNRWSKTLPRRQSQQSCKLDMVEQNKRYWTWTTMIRLDAVGSFLGSAMWCWNEVFWGLYCWEMQGFQTNIRNKLCNKNPHWCQVKLSPTFLMEVHHPKWWSDVVRIHRMVDKWAWFGLAQILIDKILWRALGMIQKRQWLIIPVSDVPDFVQENISISWDYPGKWFTKIHQMEWILRSSSVPGKHSDSSTILFHNVSQNAGFYHWRFDVQITLPFAQDTQSWRYPARIRREEPSPCPSHQKRLPESLGNKFFGVWINGKGYESQRYECKMKNMLPFWRQSTWYMFRVY